MFLQRCDNLNLRSVINGLRSDGVQRWEPAAGKPAKALPHHQRVLAATAGPRVVRHCCRRRQPV